MSWPYLVTFGIAFFGAFSLEPCRFPYLFRPALCLGHTPCPPPEPRVKPGIYRHYHGYSCRVLMPVRHTETQRSMVLYRPFVRRCGWQVRPVEGFAKKFMVDGKPQPEFELVEESLSVSIEPTSHGMVWPGIYRHYKGNYYRVFLIAWDEEVKEIVVVYQALYGEHSWWVRPAKMFVGEVLVDGRSQPRFVFVGETLPVGVLPEAAK